MPIQESVSVCTPAIKEELQISPKNSLTKNEALILLRKKEVLAYHELCKVFRAQGHLTPEKLKLLKEVAAALYIPDVRHRAECSVVLGSRELNDIAEWVAGPGSDVEWRKESVDILTPRRPAKLSNSNRMLADAVAAAVADAQRKMAEAGGDVLTTHIKVKCPLLDEDFVESKRKEKKPEKIKIEPIIKKETASEDKVKDEAKDRKKSSTVSDKYQAKGEEIKSEAQKRQWSKEELDAVLMPPPPPVIIIPSPSQPSHPSPPLPPKASPPLSSVITVPPPMVVEPTVEALEIPEIVATPATETPVISEEEAKARADFLSSLPPLVVVPPPDPSETSLPSPTLVLSPGMSIQIRDDIKKRKRSVSQSQDASATAPKTVAFSSYSKMTPVMVTAAAASSQAQVKVTPIISRAKMATTAQNQKVIIVSNPPTSSAPMLQRSLNVPMASLGLPIIRANQPRFQPVTVQSGVNVRPKMVSVPTKSRAKGSPMVNLQLKNAITLKQDNMTVMDTNVKRLPGPTKILPKPSGSMFIVNAGHGTRKLATAVGAGREGGKQNVVIVQKGGNQRTLTLSNPHKDLMQKLMSKKCVVIQSSKMMPKTISPKPPPLPPQHSSPVSVMSTATINTQCIRNKVLQLEHFCDQENVKIICVSEHWLKSNQGNTVVLDLSQEQDRQNLGGTTVRDILTAAGIITPPTTTLAEPVPVSSTEGEWLPVETSKSLSLEEVSLPLGQSESFVTLDEAVEMLEEDTSSVGEGGGLVPVSSESIFTITPDQLTGGNLSVAAEKPELLTNQIIMEALPSEVASDLECMSQSFLPHKDGAVSIQHSNIDVPTNMSLEDYSSQQMENQNFN